jgi:hypothetical protein
VSPADGISSLTGAALFAQKVRRVVANLSDFPIGTGEHNYSYNSYVENCAIYCFANWPTNVDLVLVGYTLGNSITVAIPTSNGATTTNHAGYNFIGGGGGGWNNVSATVAVMGVAPLFQFGGISGLVTGSGGNTSWAPDAPNGRHHYLTTFPPQSYAGIGNLMSYYAGLVPSIA